MPVDMRQYPTNWREIRAAIMRRATGADGVTRCEWCGVPNGAVITRDPNAGHRYTLYDDGADVMAADVDGVRLTTVVLTTAHLGTPRADGRPGDKHDKHDCRPENLAALCQRCHLLYDLDDHVRHAAETRRRKRRESGQCELELVP